MRSTSFSLVTMLSLGVALAGGRAIAAERASHARLTSSMVETPKLLPTPTERLWYGGTLAPIVVEVTAPALLSGPSGPSCSTGGR